VKEADYLAAFDRLMTTELIDLILLESNRYAMQKGSRLDITRARGDSRHPALHGLPPTTLAPHD
jgi:hypothetical protein